MQTAVDALAHLPHPQIDHGIHGWVDQGWFIGLWTTGQQQCAELCVQSGTRWSVELYWT